MANPDPSQSSPSSFSALEAEVAELRAELRALRQQMTAPRAAPATTPLSLVGSTPSSDAAASAKSAKRATSRRGLLRGAAVAGAAAAAAVAVSAAAEPAHAAPLATGGAFILGQANDADATTALYPTSGFNPLPLFQADNSGVAGIAPAISAFSQSILGAVNAQASSGGTGLYVGSDTGLGINIISSGRLAQNPQGSAGAPTSGAHYKGEQIRDSNGDMWICMANGTPGTWSKVGAVAPGLTGGAISFLAKPMRLLDSRVGATDAANLPATKLSGDWRWQVNGTNYNSEIIPSNATGVLGNVTVLNATAGGFISVSAANVGFTGTANIAFAPGQVVSNFFASAIGTYTFFKFSTTGIDTYVAGGSADVIVDVFAVTV